MREALRPSPCRVSASGRLQASLPRGCIRVACPAVKLRTVMSSSMRRRSGLMARGSRDGLTGPELIGRELISFIGDVLRVEVQ